MGSLFIPEISGLGCRSPSLLGPDRASRSRRVWPRDQENPHQHTVRTLCYPIIRLWTFSGGLESVQSVDCLDCQTQQKHIDMKHEFSSSWLNTGLRVLVWGDLFQRDWFQGACFRGTGFRGLVSGGLVSGGLVWGLVVWGDWFEGGWFEGWWFEGDWFEGSGHPSHHNTTHLQHNTSQHITSHLHQITPPLGSVWPENQRLLVTKLWTISCKMLFYSRIEIDPCLFFLSANTSFWKRQLLMKSSDWFWWLYVLIVYN